jgi:hypothetical protein
LREVADAPSVAVTVTLNGLPVALAGVPESTPVVAFSVKPSGSPAADQV